MDSELLSMTGLLLMFILGLRHDPDHIACIDGLTWRALNHNHRNAPWVGTLFAVAHGLLVTVIAVGVSQLSQKVSVSDSVVQVFQWISTGLLVLVGSLNLLTRRAAGQEGPPIPSWAGLADRHAVLQRRRLQHPQDLDAGDRAR